MKTTTHCTHKHSLIIALDPDEWFEIPGWRTGTRECIQRIRVETYDSGERFTISGVRVKKDGTPGRAPSGDRPLYGGIDSTIPASLLTAIRALITTPECLKVT